MRLEEIFQYCKNIKGILEIFEKLKILPKALYTLLPGMQLKDMTTCWGICSHYHKVLSITTVSEIANSTFFVTPFISLKRFSVLIKQFNTFAYLLLSLNFTYYYRNSANRKEELYAF